MACEGGGSRGIQTTLPRITNLSLTLPNLIGGSRAMITTASCPHLTRTLPSPILHPNNSDIIALTGTAKAKRVRIPPTDKTAFILFPEGL